MRNAQIGWFIVLIILVTETDVLADGIRHGFPGPCGAFGGWGIEERTAAPADVTVHFTDAAGEVIAGLDGHTRTVAPVGPGNAVSPPVLVPADPRVCDAINETIIGMASGPNPPVPGGNNGGPAAILHLESLVYDALGNLVLIEGTFDRIAAKVGFSVPIRIPDLFADTNGNGVLDDGDVLYSLVDVNTYLDAVPSFSIGDTFNVVNGHVATLPDMIFSTTPFIYDPLLTTSVFGSVDVSGPPGFNGSPFTGTGTVLAVHDLATVPEPTTWLLLGSGLAAFVFARKKLAA